MIQREIIYFLVAFYLLLPFISSGQKTEEYHELLRKIDSSCENTNSLQYTAKVAFKGSSPKIYKRVSNVYLKRDDKSKFKTNYFVNFVTENRKQIYTGDNIFKINEKDSLVKEYSTKTHGYGDITGNYISNHINFNIFKNKFYFKSYNMDSIKKLISLKDTLFNGQPCRLFSVMHKPPKGVSDLVAKTAIRKKDFLPIYKKFKYKFNEVNCFEETKFFGVAKNQVKTNDIFDPEKILPDYFRFKSIAKKNELTPFEKGDTIDLKKIYKEINSLKKLKESDFKKHVFYSWFYHCHACKKILPDLKSTANAIQKNNYNINIIGINPMDGKKLFERYQKENSINFNNYIVDRDWFYSTFKSSLFPTIYIVDSNGRILNAYHGNKKNIKSKILGDHKQ